MLGRPLGDHRNHSLQPVKDSRAREREKPRFVRNATSILGSFPSTTKSSNAVDERSAPTARSRHPHRRPHGSPDPTCAAELRQVMKMLDLVVWIVLLQHVFVLAIQLNGRAICTTSMLGFARPCKSATPERNGDSASHSAFLHRRLPSNSLSGRPCSFGHRLPKLGAALASPI